MTHAAVFVGKGATRSVVVVGAVVGVIVVSGVAVSAEMSQQVDLFLLSEYATIMNAIAYMAG
jgi:hypothetical protein